MAVATGMLLLYHATARRDVLFAALFVGWAAAGVLLAGEPWSRFEAAWVCLFAGGLLVSLALRPPARGDLIGSALLAVAAAAAAGIVFLLVTPFSWDELRWLSEHHFRGQLHLISDVMANALIRGGEADAARAFDTFRASADATVGVVSALLPAVLLLQSVAALAASWALYRWIAREPIAVPLPRLAEFRFNDHLIWGLILALLGILVPGLGALRALGENLTAFFGGLYVARGLAVVAAMAAAGGVGGPFAWLLGVLMLVFLLPLVALSALAVGILDTWIDWRRHVAALKR